MKNRKRSMVFFVAVMWLLNGCVTAAMGEEISGDVMTTIHQPMLSQDGIGLQEGTELVIGGTTPASGVFGTGIVAGSTTDMEIQALLDGYRTVAVTSEQKPAFNGVAIAGVKTHLESNGDRTYTLDIAQGLAYSDGSPINAKDYVFSILLHASHALRALGLARQDYAHIVGFESYQSGETAAFSGVRLISDTQFQIRIAREFLPYFYGLQMLSVQPYPYQVIAPGCDIVDDGAGAYVAAADSAQRMDGTDMPYAPGAFGEDMLAFTLLDRQEGYVYNPVVTSGPYALRSFDAQTGEVVLRANEHFAGNFEGNKPHIQTLRFSVVDNADMMEKLSAGDIHLLNKVSAKDAVEAGKALADKQNGARYKSYPRSGLAYLSFACETGVTAQESVRRAISLSIDRNALIQEALGAENGVPVGGYYGMGQWMTNLSFPADPLRNVEALNVQEILGSMEIHQDIARAKQYLINGGWTLNEKGKPFAEERDSVRYLDSETSSVPLEIRFAKASGSDVANVLEGLLAESFEQLGMRLVVEEMPFQQMIRHYYRQVARQYDMFLIGNNFRDVFDPSLDFSTGDAYQGQLNTTGLRDDALMEIAQSMRETPPAQAREYVEKWLMFQQRLAEQVAIAPLYSGMYHDFYVESLQDYNIVQRGRLAEALCYAWLGDALPDANADEELIPIDLSGSGT